MTNVGSTSLSITSISLVGTNPSDFSQTSTCGTSVVAGGRCALSLTFHPTATGTRSASISITDNGGASPQSISLSGTGTQVKLSASSLAFLSTVLGQTSSAKAVTLTNVGSTLLSITSVSFAGTNPSDFSQTNTCGTSVVACALSLHASLPNPTATGTRSASISITDNGGASPQSISLSGVGQ